MALKDWKKEEGYGTKGYYVKRSKGYDYGKYAISIFAERYIKNKGYNYVVSIVQYNKIGKQLKIIEKGFNTLFHSEKFAKAYMRKH